MKFRFFLGFLLMSISTHLCWSQEDFVAVGGDGSAASGSVSYSVGQVAYDHDASGLNGSVNEGVQQPDLTISTASINEAMADKAKVLLYPNPTTSYVNLQLEVDQMDASFCELYDVNGKCILKQMITSELSVISLVDLSPSTYFLKVYNQSTEIKSFKIIKNN